MDNGIIGNMTGVNLPETVVPIEDLDEEKKMARFSKTKEFQRLQTYINARIGFYQTFLPDGQPVATNTEDSINNWKIANIVIGELKQLLEAYESAKEVVNASQD